MRWARPGDLAGLRALHRASSRVSEPEHDIVGDHPELAEPTAEQVAARQVRVVLDDGRVAGFSTLVLHERHAELDALFVDPAALGRGLGRALVEDAAARASAAGRPRVEVTANPHAAGFYERVGFARRGPVATRFGPAIRMVRYPAVARER